MLCTTLLLLITLNIVSKTRLHRFGKGSEYFSLFEDCSGTTELLLGLYWAAFIRITTSRFFDFHVSRSVSTAEWAAN
ncbi:hypothetical protein FB446DRAFT_728465 [Lentinula raphanica]|nr:hypothetical protein FB446DRAFT_728465 [Lentinula raphanica]